MPKKEIELKERKPCSIAYIGHMGEYGEIPFDKYIPQLYGWAKENRVMPGFLPMGIYYDNPDETPLEKCRSDVAITFKGNGKPSGGVKVKELPAAKVAVIKFKGPSKDIKPTYQRLMEWVAQNGYEFAGPCIEIYTKKPKVVGGETILYMHVQAPVKKKR